MSPGSVARLRVAVTVVLVAGVAIAFATASSRAREVTWPSRTAVVASLLLASVNLLTGAVSWAVMFPTATERSRVARAFLVGQFGKYVPGGVVQVASVVDLTRRSGIAGNDIAVAMPVHALAAIVAPGLLATSLFVVFDERLPGPIRAAIAVGSATLAAGIVRRRWLATIFDFAHRRWRRLPDGSHVPPSRRLVLAASFGFIGFVSYGSAFAVLLGPSAWRPFAVAAAGFGVAFLAGFVALPVPSGVGIREGVLVAAVGSLAPLVDVLAAAVVLRVTQLAAEVAVFTIAVAVPRLGRLRSR